MAETKVYAVVQKLPGCFNLLGFFSESVEAKEYVVVNAGTLEIHEVDFGVLDDWTKVDKLMNAIIAKEGSDA